MARFVRDSKFRHVFLAQTKREKTYEGLKVANTQSDSAMLKANSKYFAFAEESGGGAALCVIPLTSFGKNHVPIQSSSYKIPLFRGHSSKLLDFDFSPFEDVIVSGGDDHLAQVWNIPEGGLLEDCTAASVTLRHDGKVNGLYFHPCASSLLASTTPSTVRLWDAETGSEIACYADVHGDAIQSGAWSFDGGLFATTCRDKRIRVLDPRIGGGGGASAVVASFEGHRGNRTARCVWAGRRGNVLISTGFSQQRQQELAVWDLRAVAATGAPAPAAGAGELGARLFKKTAGSSSSVGVPLYDADSNLLYVGAKGERSVSVWENVESKPFMHSISAQSTSVQSKGMCLVPKTAMDVMGCEVGRLLQLTANSVNPLRFEVPRKNKRIFHEDIYPDTRGSVAACTAQQWMEGATAVPALVSLAPSAGAIAAAGRSSRSSSTGSNGSSAGASAAWSRRSSSTSSGSGESKAAAGAGEAEVIPELSAEQEAKQQMLGRKFKMTAKFKYIKGTSDKRDLTYFNWKPDVSAVDSPLLSVNSTFLALPWGIGGGGPVYVHPLTATGKLDQPANAICIRGHKNPVLSTAFSPFDDYVLATGSDDTHVKIWRIPSADGLSSPMGPQDCLVDMVGHGKGVRTTDWHPTAENLLFTSSGDETVRIWDVSTGQEAACLSGLFQTNALNLSFSYNGSAFALASRDRHVRVIDPRAGGGSGAVTASAITHAGSKGHRVVWLGDSPYLFTVGFGRQGEREACLWDSRDMSTQLQRTKIDTGSGLYLPLYDEDTGVVLLSAKGESLVRVFEINTGVGAAAAASASATPPAMHACVDFVTRNDPACGVALAPKRCCAVAEVELMRLMRLTTSAVEPVSFKLPRAEKLRGYFQDDIFPETRAPIPSLSAAAWLAGENADPTTTSLRPEGMPLLSEKPPEARVIPKTVNFAKRAEAEAERQHKRDASFDRMQNLAVQYGAFNANKSMGAQQDDDDSSGCEWSD